MRNHAQLRGFNAVMEKEELEKHSLPLLEASRRQEGLASPNSNSSDGWKPDPCKELSSTMVLEGVHQYEVYCLTMSVTTNAGALATGPGLVLLTYSYLEGTSKHICEYLLDLPLRIMNIELLNNTEFLVFQEGHSKGEGIMWDESIQCIWHLYGVAR